MNDSGALARRPRGGARLGIGTRLLLLLLDRARDDGFQALSLSVDPDNPARRLYERPGFVRVGGAAAWTMRADLRS